MRAAGRPYPARHRCSSCILVSAISHGNGLLCRLCLRGSISPGRALRRKRMHGLCPQPLSHPDGRRPGLSALLSEVWRCGPFWKRICCRILAYGMYESVAPSGFTQPCFHHGERLRHVFLTYYLMVGHVVHKRGAIPLRICRLRGVLMRSLRHWRVLAKYAPNRVPTLHLRGIV